MFARAHRGVSSNAFVRRELILSWGYIDASGRVVIKPQFDWAYGFSEGLAPVRKAQKWGFLDEKGNFVLTPTFDGVRGFSEGLAGVATGSYWGRPKTIYGYSDGRFFGGTWGYVDSSGAMPIDPQFADCGDFREGIARIQDKDTKKWGYVDRTGKIVIAPQFSEATDFSHGRACVMVGFGDSSELRWGIIDRTGKWIVKPKFRLAHPFSEGLAPVARWETTPGVYMMPGRIPVGAYIWGFVNINGQTVVPLEFYHVTSFSGGLAAVAKGREFFSLIIQARP